eukprot:1152416-Pelagomonas_calceolata.AAC.4
MLHLPLSFQKFTNHAWPAFTASTQGKRVGMITPSRFQILYKAFYRAKLAGLHETITPAPTSFASELQGLLARKAMLEEKHASKNVKDFFWRVLPSILPSKNGVW